MNKIFISAVVAAVTMLSACSSAKKVVIPDLTTVTYRELLQHNLAWQKSIFNLSGEARITLDTKQYSGNHGVDVYLSGSDSLLISVTGPLGIRVGKLFIAKNRFIFYSQVTNQFYTGRKEDFSNMTFLQFPIEISELPSLLLAHDHFDILRKEQFTIRDQMYFLDAYNGSNQYRIWFDPAIKLIRRIEYLRDDELIYAKNYDQYELVNGVYFPRQINYLRVVDDNEKQGISVYYNNLVINTPIPQNVFDINVSDSATQIDLSLDGKP
ncbi:MAG: DUF4292 domain-containing protein [Calditrichaceae bacterium]|jgi:hypothetical protein